MSKPHVLCVVSTQSTWVIFRHKTVFVTMTSLVVSSIRAINIFVLYLSLIMVTSVIGMVMFQEKINNDIVSSSYSNILRAIITTFVYLTTGENYEDTVYPAIDDVHATSIIYFICLLLIGSFGILPIIIHSFESGYRKRQQYRVERQNRNRKRAAVASFIVLDTDGNEELGLIEFRKVLDAAPQKQRDKIWRLMDKSEDNVIQLEEFCEAMMKLDLNKTLLRKTLPSSHDWQAYLEIYIYRSSWLRKGLLVLVIFPQLFIGALYGLVNNTDTLDQLFIFFYILNWADVLLRIITYGPIRFFYYDTQPTPTKIRRAERLHKARLEDMARQRTVRQYQYSPTRGSRGSRDTAGSSSFSIPFFKNIPMPSLEMSYIEPETNWQKEAIRLANVFDAFICCCSLAILIYQIPRYGSDPSGVRTALSFTCLRMFTQFSTNRNLMVLLLKVWPEFLSLFLITLLFMMMFAQLGTSLFHDEFSKLLPDDQPKASFDTLWDSMITLLQLLVGEGWHDIMYKTVLATNQLGWSFYFVIYIILITLIILNLFIGLVLSSVEIIEQNRALENQEAENHSKPPEQRALEVEKEIRKVKREHHLRVSLLESEKKRLQKLMNDQAEGELGYYLHSDGFESTGSLPMQIGHSSIQPQYSFDLDL